MESSPLSEYLADSAEDAAKLWAEEWLDASGDSCPVLVTCGEQSWTFETSVAPPEYDVKEITA